MTWWRRPVARLVAVAVVMGAAGAAHAVVYQGVIPYAAALLGLTACLIGLVLWNERYGADPIYNT